ncbi:MAG: DUF1295 domain-containing protein [Hoeflea sp.]|uniref:DUF1295 domain-containing protein n=1 Tax=Hoeflea sp. TaxID=1940281 RepID=UPI001D6749C7|nr:DUF1295 domain-containing protein [Hoeflea sp.]MBU4530046.1 DUF1295 domain-containing protein [Alphaproteobacteria bacterium]MBU4542669.1 DUF1295 domain-containing protein [Alphaproteobacteria bacterium]MBU4551350.1 DUF1295 domain-containing protein [Alphaproteobacteria bacterium]MBV1723173.1 DUF1295 domain-containing protein [Hoeflea sp.]MBV1760184.1 DUF1295 domain-containing protein [Hoeflea sp.]
MDSLLTTSLVLTILAFTAIWLFHVPLKDAGIVDYYWGPGFAMIGWAGLMFGAEASPVKLLLIAAITIWSARLAGQLIMRHRLMAGEDARYAKMRSEGGPHWWWQSLYKVFLLQAVILWIVATPVHALLAAPVNASLSHIGEFGLFVFAAGLLIESVADWQLYRHRREGKSGRETLASGLWAYSRHPNYFGEILLWFGMGLAAYDLSGFWWAFVGPVVLALVIRFVSLPLTERHLMASRTDYGPYVARTPVLVPLLRSGSFNAGPAE